MNDLYIIVDKDSGKPLTGVYSTYNNAKYEYDKMGLPERYVICIYSLVTSMEIILE